MNIGESRSEYKIQSRGNGWIKVRFFTTERIADVVHEDITSEAYTRTLRGTETYELPRYTESDVDNYLDTVLLTYEPPARMEGQRAEQTDLSSVRRKHLGI